MQRILKKGQVELRRQTDGAHNTQLSLVNKCFVIGFTSGSPSLQKGSALRISALKRRIAFKSIFEYIKDIFLLLFCCYYHTGDSHMILRALVGTKATGSPKLSLHGMNTLFTTIVAKWHIEV
jgi:hypothetical protein